MGKETKVAYVTGVRYDGGLLTYTHVGTQDEFREDIWNADELVWVSEMRLRGKTYDLRKNDLRRFVQEFQANDDGGMTYSEYMEVADFIERNARKYGLVKELRNEGIIA